MDMSHVGTIAETRCSALDGRFFEKPGEEVASILREWLSGEPLPAAEEEAAEAKTIDAFSLAAYRFEGIQKYLKTPERIRDWYEYAIGRNFEETDKSRAVLILQYFISYRDNGLKSADAVTAAIASADADLEAALEALDAEKSDAESEEE
jgi:hypothetical protein